MKEDNMLTSNQLNVHKKGDVIFTTFPHIEKSNLVYHGFSTKHGGISTGCYASMNLSKTRGDMPFCVDENFHRFSSAIGVVSDSLVFADQIHEAEIRVVDKEDCGKGFTRSSDVIGIDGLITNVPGVTLTTFYADCVPLFFLDPVKKVIGLSHAGWRGTVKAIGAKTVEKMTDVYNCNPANILVGIGPSIGQCCYEVSKDVILQFEKRFNRGILDKIGKKIDDTHYMLDLWEANRQILMETGIREANIVTTDLCTKCNSDDFYSHRVMGSNRGSLAGMLALKG